MYISKPPVALSVSHTLHVILRLGAPYGPMHVWYYKGPEVRGHVEGCHHQNIMTKLAAANNRHAQAPVRHTATLLK